MTVFIRVFLVVVALACAFGLAWQTYHLKPLKQDEHRCMNTHGWC